MKDIKDIEFMLTAPYKLLERELGIKIRNGQAGKAVRACMIWFLQNKPLNRDMFNMRKTVIRGKQNGN